MKKLTIIPGDGIGKEVMEAAILVLDSLEPKKCHYNP